MIRLGALGGILACLALVACGGDDSGGGGGGGGGGGKELTIYSSLPLQGAARPQSAKSGSNIGSGAHWRKTAVSIAIA